MAKKKKAKEADLLEQRRKIKELVVIAMFADDALMERLVLKGGNALDLVHKVSARASIDIDLSMEGDFTDAERKALQGVVEKSLVATFRPEGFQPFDVTVYERPEVVSDDVRSFWGGYCIEFKIIDLALFEKHQPDLQALRRNAVHLGQGSKFSIDISKHEYTAGKASVEIDHITIFVYTPEMIVCEKLRAICQQMDEYSPVVHRNRPGASRARDFVDIHLLLTDCNIDLTSNGNRSLLANIFAAKRVKLSLLRRVAAYREFHASSFPAVVASVKPGVVLEAFDFYFDFVLHLIQRLEPLGDE